LNHEHNKNPLDRSLEPYIRPEFVASETGLILALRSLALVDLLLEPSLDCLSAVSHVTAHPIADWAVAVVSPAVQGMNGDAQHFRDIRERHQLVTGLEGHDHLPFRGSQSGSVGACRISVATWAQSPRRPGKRLGRTARPIAYWRPSKNLSRETTVGGREQQQELNSHDQLGCSGRCACRRALRHPGALLADSGWSDSPCAMALTGPSVDDG
jgi:hypothetical protein